MKPKVLAVIPARGGSKGVPRKNVRLLAGTPLIGHMIYAAKKSRFVDRLVVSTDDNEIAGVSKSLGAEVIVRPTEISGDKAASELALLHVLETLKNSSGYTPDILVFLQCTSPLTLPEDIDGTVETLIREKAGSAFTASRFFHFLWKTNDSGDAVAINHDKLIRPMRQEREAQFLETGSVVALNVQGFTQFRHRFFGKTTFYEVPAERALEIDEPIDFEIAEIILERRQIQNRKELLPKKIGAVVFDFDGVFTDNRILTDETGKEAVLCNRSDSWGLSEFRKFDIPVIILSTETNPVVQMRAKKLQLSALSGAANKGEVLKQWMREKQVSPDEVVYVGNDTNDLPCFDLVSCPIAPADAHPKVRSKAKIILTARGGEGCVREVLDLISSSLEANEHS